jgi:hypothetical protein
MKHYEIKTVFFYLAFSLALGMIGSQLVWLHGWTASDWLHHKYATLPHHTLTSTFQLDYIHTL